jgi:hypothetical protein
MKAKEPRIPKRHPMLPHSYNIMLQDIRGYLARVKRSNRRKTYLKGNEQ